MTSTLTLSEPYASAIVNGIAGWHTSDDPPPEELVGQRLIVVATATDPGPVEGWTVITDFLFTTDVIRQQAREDAPHGRDVDLHPGCIVGAVTLAERVPVTDGMEGIRHSPHVFDWGPSRAEPLVFCDGSIGADISDQLPWADWSPGRWAWRFENPKPMTQECPVCGGTGSVPVTGNGYDGFDQCPECSSHGTCPPIPYSAPEGLSVFDPGRLR